MMPPHRELADDHYVPDLEPLWQVAARPQIGTFRNRQLGDLAMNEHFVGIEINNLGRRHPAVRTPYPEILWPLLAHQRTKERRIDAHLGLRPSTVVGQQLAGAAVRGGGIRDLRNFVQGDRTSTRRNSSNKCAPRNPL